MAGRHEEEGKQERNDSVPSARMDMNGPPVGRLSGRWKKKVISKG